MEAVNNLITISDLHCGCQMGLCPPTVHLRHGGIYQYSKFQAIVYSCWESFWKKWVPQVTKGEPYAVLVNGDSIDGRHHGATTQITQDLSDQVAIAYELLAPIREKATHFYYISGTESHAGQAGEDEEDLAKRLGADKDEVGAYSRYELYIRIKDALVHASHHIGVTGSMAYETTALTKEYNEFCAESARWHRPIPDILIRSHRHRHSEVRVPTINGYGIICVTPGWQLKTPFLFRTPGGRVSTPVIGGTLVRQGDEEHYTRHKTWETQRRKTETPTIGG